MSERKVLNKYYPPDFDPTKIPKLKLAKDRQYVVRLMAPFNMRCTTCGEYIYKGKKFNARKETVQGETYLGLYIFRFYIRCPKCISEITFKTDPENTDYVCEKGATRNFQAQLMLERQEEAAKQEREDEEMNNPMKALENRTKESKQEMDIIEKLEELRDLNTRHADVNYESMLEIYRKYEEDMKIKEEQEDEALVSSIFGSNKIQRRLSDSDSDDDNQEKPTSTKTTVGKKRATDVLTEDSGELPSASSSKKPKVWEKSIGTIQSKSLLSSLVKVKKTKPNTGDAPIAQSSTVSNDESNKDTTKTKPSTGDAPKAQSSTVSNDESNKDTTKTKPNTGDAPKAQSSTVSNDESNKDTTKTKPSTGESPKAQTSTVSNDESNKDTTNNSGSLGMLGDYGSSSDSD